MTKGELRFANQSPTPEIMGISRRKFLQSLLVGGGAVALGGVGISKLLESQVPLTLSDRVLKFSYTGLSSNERGVFVRDIVSEYIKATQTPRLNLEEIVNSNRISFHSNTVDFNRAVSSDCGSPNPNSSAWTCYDSGRIYFSQTKLMEQSSPRKDLQGIFLAGLIIHEIGHTDLEPRLSNLNNDPRYWFDFRNGKGRQPYFAYRGVQVYAEDRSFGFNNTEEVFVDTLKAWLLKERLSLLAPAKLIEDENRYSLYYKDGVEILLPFVRRIMPFQQFYNLHATSDFEGMAEALGRNLPGSNTAFEKGRELMIGFQERNIDRIARTGVLPFTR